MNTATLIPWRWKTEEDKGYLQLHQAMNELFNSFSYPQSTEFPLMPSYAVSRTYVPRLDISETDKEVYVMIELPGLEEKDVNVSLSGDQLIISGEKREERENRTYHRIERRWGAFQRSLPLYWEVDRNSVKAIFNKGVLTVTLTKTLKAQEMVRKIPIKSM